jgi:hypothetical protein
VETECGGRYGQCSGRVVLFYGGSTSEIRKINDIHHKFASIMRQSRVLARDD